MGFLSGDLPGKIGCPAQRSCSILQFFEEVFIPFREKQEMTGGRRYPPGPKR